jgi:hypothetical protein
LIQKRIIGFLAVSIREIKETRKWFISFNPYNRTDLKKIKQSCFLRKTKLYETLKNILEVDIVKHLCDYDYGAKNTLTIKLIHRSFDSQMK